MTKSALATIAAIGTAVPPCVLRQSEAYDLIRRHYGTKLKPRSLAVLKQVLSHPAIEKRHLALDSLDQITCIRDETPDQRMDRFNRWSVALGRQALANALSRAGLVPRDIGALLVNTCTGYICPGISTYILDEMGLASDTQVFDLVGAGCGGALPNISLGASVLAHTAKPAVACISVEICTATFQMDDDMSLLISNAIFGDGATAVILRRDGPGFSVSSMQSRILPRFREDVRYVYKNGQLHNRISSALPKITGEGVAALVGQFLDERGLSLSDIDRWAIHPGGDKILNEIQARLRLSDAAMAPSRDVHRDYGNMSSPSVVFVLDRIVKEGIVSGSRCLMTAFGTGMSIFAMILEGT